jgi:multicomponent Na+:H+ antiporter subunit G
MLALIGSIVLFIGSVFLLLGAVGILRMPDSYTRIQAGTKATTLGTMLTMLGIALMHPAWWPKVLVLILFIVFTNPVSSHVLARAAYHIGVPLDASTVVDKMGGKE